MKRRDELGDPDRGKRRRGAAEEASGSDTDSPSSSSDDNDLPFSDTMPISVSSGSSDGDERERGEGGGEGGGGDGVGPGTDPAVIGLRLVLEKLGKYINDPAPIIGPTRKNGSKRGPLIWEVLEQEHERWIDEHGPIDSFGEILGGTKPEEETVDPSPDVVLPLLRFQKEWLAWALKQEASNHRGGVLADEMGMGKTIQAISLVLTARSLRASAGLPDSRASPKSCASSSAPPLPVTKCTLVICPVAAVTQWGSEIKKHTKEGSASVLVFHGPKRSDTEYNFDDYDFVVTTYSTIAWDFRQTLMSNKEECKWCRNMISRSRMKLHLKYYCGPDAQKTEKQSKQVKKKKANVPILEQNRSSVSNDETGYWDRGPAGSPSYGEHDEPTDVPEEPSSVLHSVKWERIVLDEAHSIKDRSSNSAKAVFALQSFYKWALSGTPIQNRVGEFYCLVRFLQINPFAFYFCTDCDCKILDYSAQQCPSCGHFGLRHFCWWNRYITKPINSKLHLERGKRAMILLKDKVLKSIVLRRTKKGKMAELALPPRIETLRRDTLDNCEQEIYEALSTRSQTEFNTYASAGTIVHNYAHIFALLTRLRQACDHPYLVCSKASDVPDGSEFDTSEVSCGICHAPLEDPLVTPCGHSFCRMCLIDYPAVNRSVSCPSCSKPLPLDSKTDLSVEKRAKVSIEGFKDSSILNRLDIQKFKMSTKIHALREEIMNMIEGDCSAKALVFSQFTSFLDLIHYSLKMSGIMCVQLVGSMSLAEREKAINFFTENANCKIFLLSLKAGGVALNLTVASHVFLMDPWWNPAVEHQAQDRIYRIGQYKPVRTVRFVTEGTVEDKILQLQKKKDIVLEGTIGDSLEGMAQLSDADLKFLFQN